MKLKNISTTQLISTHPQPHQKCPKSPLNNVRSSQAINHQFLGKICIVQPQQYASLQEKKNLILKLLHTIKYVHQTPRK